MEVIFLHGAEADLLASWMGLPGLGDRFEAEVPAGSASAALSNEQLARPLTSSFV
jgi:hypothetical protein